MSVCMALTSFPTMVVYWSVIYWCLPLSLTKDMMSLVFLAASHPSTTSWGRQHQPPRRPWPSLVSLCAPTWQPTTFEQKQVFTIGWLLRTMNKSRCRQWWCCQDEWVVTWWIKLSCTLEMVNSGWHKIDKIMDIRNSQFWIIKIVNLGQPK